ncbi:hypothetical protein SE91_21020 [Bradyrhizobium sp. DOA1]|nr:hypothetical protein SE91_21020 [Bradyrhizobium sp. DOA1]
MSLQLSCPGRSAARRVFAAWCAAEPGPMFRRCVLQLVGPGSAQQRQEALQRVRDTATMCTAPKFILHCDRKIAHT